MTLFSIYFFYIYFFFGVYCDFFSSCISRDLLFFVFLLSFFDISRFLPPIQYFFLFFFVVFFV